MIDYHMHGNFCGHAEGELEEYVLNALGKGFVEIGFSDHLPKVVAPDPYHAMLEERLPEYVSLVEHLKRKFSGSITIKLGIESDFFPGYEKKTREILSRYPFDYVLGSLHFLGDWHFSSKAGRGRYSKEDPAEVFPRYYELVAEMLETGLFDVLAHADAVRKSDFLPEGSLQEEYGRIADLLAAGNMAIEVNTAGLRRGAGSVYPDRDLLEACVSRDVPVTLGSDAHKPEDVGRDFMEAFELLESAGADTIAIFTGRKMTRKPISDFMGLSGRGSLYRMMSGDGGRTASGDDS